MRLIDADALKKQFEDRSLEDFTYLHFIDAIDNAPTFELDESVIQSVLNKRCMTAVTNEYLIALHGKRPQGEWIEHYDTEDGFTWLTCSRCMFKAYEEDYNFCPNCGAEMKKEAEK